MGKRDFRITFDNVHELGPRVCFHLQRENQGHTPSGKRNQRRRRAIRGRG